MNYHRSVKLDDTIHCYLWQGMGNNCNTVVLAGILKGDKPHVMIDPGHAMNESREFCFASLEQKMNKDGLKVEDIGLILNTHTHPDHCESNEKIIDLSGAGVALSKEEDEFRLTTGERLYQMFGLKAPRFTPLFYLTEGYLDLGKDGFQAQVFLTPGHSPGSVCFYLPASKVLITGDVIFFMSVGRTDFPGGNAKLLANSIERLSKLDVEYIIPGHNTDPRGIIEGKENVQRNFETVKMFF
jgi:glyoxylase-like metal-dependent hydrolase (beta-lactamase superfamily II)